METNSVAVAVTDSEQDYTVPTLAQALGSKPEGSKARRGYFSNMDLGILATISGLQARDPEQVTPGNISKVTGLALSDVKWRVMMLCKWTGPGPEARTDRLQVPEGVNMHRLWADFSTYSGIPAPVADETPEETPVVDITAEEEEASPEEALLALLPGSGPDEAPEATEANSPAGWAPEAPVETKREKRNRLAREKRAAARAEKAEQDNS